MVNLTKFILILMLCKGIDSNIFKTRNKSPQARTLIFPHIDPTVLSLIYGIGIPVEDLEYEYVTSGYIYRVQYFLPIKAEQLTANYLKPQKVHRRNIIVNETLSKSKIYSKNKRQTENYESLNMKNASIYRWIVYKAIELAFNSSGLSGKACMLLTICDHASSPMHYGAGILAELLHIILTPSTSRDKFSNPMDKEYLNAEYVGYSGKDCKQEFKNCTKSPMDLITAVFDLDNLYF